MYVNYCTQVVWTIFGACGWIIMLEKNWSCIGSFSVYIVTDPVLTCVHLIIIKLHLLLLMLIIVTTLKGEFQIWGENYILSEVSTTHMFTISRIARKKTPQNRYSLNWVLAGLCKQVIFTLFYNLCFLLVMPYTTPFHTNCVGVRWKMCTAYTASFRHSLKKVTVCFSPHVCKKANAFNICIFKREFIHLCRGVGLGV